MRFFDYASGEDSTRTRKNFTIFYSHTWFRKVLQKNFGRQIVLGD